MVTKSELLLSLRKIGKPPGVDLSKKRQSSPTEFSVNSIVIPGLPLTIIKVSLSKKDFRTKLYEEVSLSSRGPKFKILLYGYSKQKVSPTFDALVVNDKLQK